MKTERRHDLRENELARRIESAVLVLRERSKTIAVAGVVALALVVGGLLYSNSRAAAVDETWQTIVTPPDKLASKPEDQIARFIELADRGVDNTATAFAANNAADVALKALQKARADGDSPAVKRWADEAERLFKRLLEAAGSDVTSLAAARLGLACVAEERRDYATARQIYDEMVSDPRFHDTPFADQARYRLAGLAEWKQDIVFAAPLPSPLLPSSEFGPPMLTQLPDRPAATSSAAPVPADRGATATRSAPMVPAVPREPLPGELSSVAPASSPAPATQPAGPGGS